MGRRGLRTSVVGSSLSSSPCHAGGAAPANTCTGIGAWHSCGGQRADHAAAACWATARRPGGGQPGSRPVNRRPVAIRRAHRPTCRQPPWVCSADRLQGLTWAQTWPRGCLSVPHKYSASATTATLKSSPARSPIGPTVMVAPQHRQRYRRTGSTTRRGGCPSSSGPRTWRSRCPCPSRLSGPATGRLATPHPGQWAGRASSGLGVFVNQDLREKGLERILDGLRLFFICCDGARREGSEPRLVDFVGLGHGSVPPVQEAVAQLGSERYQGGSLREVARQTPGSLRGGGRSGTRYLHGAGSITARCLSFSSLRNIPPERLGDFLHCTWPVGERLALWKR